MRKKKRVWGGKSAEAGNILDKYEKLLRRIGDAEGTILVVEIASASFSFLKANAQQVELRSLVTGKSYFAFRLGAKTSRAVNRDLFLSEEAPLNHLLVKLASNPIPVWLPAAECNQLLYTIAMSFCVFNDLTAEKDQKTPGTFFEAFIGHFFSLTFGVKPRKKVEVLTVEDERSTLKTDYIFDLGPGRLKFHVPVKTSTRERAIQVWTHQHMLNGVYGGGRFRGMLVALAETKVNLKTLEVTEICLPAQWAVYQRFVARMDRIYYLDIPEKYAALATKFPYISVKTLGEFFVEKDTLCDPAPL